MNKTNYICASLVIVMITSLAIIANAETNVISITYKSYVDTTCGFCKVRDVTTNKPSPYENRTLTINQGDIIIWINDAENKQIVITSEQGLWSDNGAFLKSLNDKFSYTFSQPGRYTFHIRDVPVARQTVIVNSVDDYPVPTHTTTYDPTPTAVATKYSPRSVATYGITPTTVVAKYSPRPVATSPQFPDINIPIKVTPTTIASIIVAVISIFITHRYGKN